MKKTNKIIPFFIAFVLMLGYSACEQEIEVEDFEGKAVDFNYQATSIHYVIGEEIKFTNTSKMGSTWQWSFGDGNTSSEKDPAHKYESPGTYTVTLEVDGGKYKIEKSIMVSDIIPIVSYSSTDPVIVFNQSEVIFDVKLLNPENLAISYTWSFPEGTKGEGINDNGKSELASPKATFGSIGSQIVSLVVKFGEKELSPISVNVQVNYNKPVKTLYYAVKDGNLMASRIINDDIDVINKPFNLGYRSGKHPLSLQIAGDWVYVFDAGTRISYTPKPDGVGDGEIFAIANDGSKRESVIENFGGNTYYDFYYGYIDQESNTIYWGDRREGVFRASLNTRNAKFSLGEFSYFVRNYWLGYYGKGIYWGNVNGPITKIGNTWWWGKNSNGAGIFRFNESDIKGEPVSAEEPEPTAGAILGTFTIRGMAVDKINKHIYVASQSHKGIFCFDLETGNFVRIVELFGADDEPATSNENVFICGMDIDSDENGEGYLYYAYRGPEGTEDPKLKSGIKRYKLNDAAAKPEFFIEGVRAYGIAIDNIAK